MSLTNLTNLQPVHVHSIGIGTFDGSVSIGGTLTYEDVTNVDSIGIVTARDDINIITDGKKLNIGASADLQLHHTANHSYVDDAGAGNLRLRSGTLEIQNLASSKTSAVFSSGGGQTLNFNNSTKFVTTNTGVVITGICTATSFKGDGSALTGITQTTINNNADNRVITGSGTANTLNGESELTYNGSGLLSMVSTGSNSKIKFQRTGTSIGGHIQTRDESNDKGLTYVAQDGNSAKAGHVFITDQTSDGSSPQERLRIKPDGDVEVKTGNLVMTSGKGIDFSADSSGTLKSLPNSFNAELLHDYENGTFTPNIQYDSGTNRYSGGNVSSAVGEYIRIGDLVNFGMKITLTSNQNHTEGTHIYIGGLPYNGLHSSQQSSMQNGWGGWACPTNDNNFSYEVRYCYHGYTTVNLGFSQSSGNGGISGFYVWGFYRCAP